MILMTQPHNLILQYTGFIISALYMIVTVRWAGATWSSFGFTTKHAKEAVRFLFFPTLSIVALIILAKFFFPFIFIQANNSPLLTLQYVFFSVPLQEILFRAWCVWRCRLTFKNILFIVIFNSMTFAMYHMIFQNVWFVTAVFLVNLLWSYAFIRYPNIYIFMLSHAIIGTVYFLPI